MKLSEYFQTMKGTGVLATADAQGRVDAAIYAHPHFIDEEMIAFIMADKLTHHNLQSNPYAVYLFMENEGGRYQGRRLYLTKIREEKENEKMEAIRRKRYSALKGKEFLVYFRVDKVLPLIGAGSKG